MMPSLSTVLLVLLAASPALSYTYNRGGSVVTTPPPTTEQAEELQEQQQESANTYLSGLLQSLGGYYANSGSFQAPTTTTEEPPEDLQELIEETQEIQQEQAEQAGEYLQDIVEQVVDTLYGTTAAPAPTTTEEDDEDTTPLAPITYAPVVTTTEEDDEDTTTVAPITYAPVVTTTEEDDEDEVTTPAPVTYAPVVTTTEDDEDDDDVITYAPVATTTEEDDEDDTTVAPVTYAPVVTTTEDDEDDDDDDDETTTVSATTTTEESVTRTLSPVDDDDDDDDDHFTTVAPAVPTSAVPNMCDGCEFVHGVGYNPHPSDCTLFVQCRMGTAGKPVVAGVQACPHGLYWNQKKLTCDYRTNVQCVDDICRSYVKKTKRSAATCRGYWDCTSGTAVAKCCPRGYAYNPVTNRCQYQPGCLDDCLSSSTPTSFECPNGMRPVAGDKTVYEVKTAANTWVRMPCPAGLGFSVGPPCGCNVRLNNPVPQECRPELYLPFNGDAKDQSGQQIYVKNEGVIVQHGKAFFNGESRLIINRFSNSWWGRTVYVQVRFKSLALDTRYALVSNGDCQVTPSLAMCAGPNGVDFFAETQNSAAPANFTVPYGYDSGDGWQEVLYALDSDKLTGFVGLNQESETAKGVLQTRQRGLVIGSGGGCENFTGFIDEVIVFLCRPGFKK